MRRTPVVVWQTTSYPFGQGEQFITPELEAWAARDVRVVMLPMQADGPRRPLPDNFEVDLRLARLWSSRPATARALAGAVGSGLLPRELAILFGDRRLAPGRAAAATRAAGQALLVREALRGIAADLGRPVDLVYTYWLKPHTVGALLAREDGRCTRVMTRAHSSDVYEQIRPHHYNALVRQGLRRGAMTERGIDEVHAISQLAADHLVQGYGLAPEQVRVARLGVTVPTEPGMTPAGAPGELQLLSVSSLTPLKRPGLLVETVREMAEARPGLRVEWRHYGSGPLEAQVREQVSAELEPLGVEVRLHGQVDHDELLRELEQPCDLMLNVSSSEGVPVSIMEAGVRGIPCLATDVGATSEVVDPASGYLVGVEEDAVSVAGRALSLLDDAREDTRRRAVAALVSERFDAARNFSDFVDGVLARVATPGGDRGDGRA